LQTKINEVSFQDLNLNTPLYNALDDLGFSQATPIQEQAFNIIASGKDVVGIAQTGTGKTFAYMLPILKNLKYSRQDNPRVLVLVPTRELVVQVVEEIEKLSRYINNRVLGVYGGVNINPQKKPEMAREPVSTSWVSYVARRSPAFIAGSIKTNRIHLRGTLADKPPVAPRMLRLN